MSKINDRVKDILTKYPPTRDCNYKLYGNLLYVYFPELLSVSLHNYLNSMIRGEYPKIETVTRCSRQLQEKFPELRGKEWKERQKQVEPVKKNLGYNTK